MVGVISQLASQPGKKIQAFVKQRTKLDRDGDRNLLKQQTNTNCSVVHAIPGRMRWRIPRIAEDSQYLERLEALLKADPLVKSDRINSIAASVVIQYEQSEISDAQMRSRLFNLIQSASNAVVIPVVKKFYYSPSTSRTCSIAIRQVVVKPESCGLLKSKTKRSLKGVALIGRIKKLHRVGILI